MSVHLKQPTTQSYMKLNLFAIIFFGSIFFTPSISTAQSHADDVKEYRSHYREKFINSRQGLLKESDLKYLRFYDPDSTYIVECTFRLTPDAKEFMMPTYSGLERPYIKYGILTFTLKGQKGELSLYQNLSLKDDPAFKDYLFIPFKDKTNGSETYGGGRYLEMRTGEIVNNKTFIDFNICYNPYCAYTEGFNCPIPPTENHLNMKIAVGEKIFGK